MNQLPHEVMHMIASYLPRTLGDGGTSEANPGQASGASAKSNLVRPSVAAVSSDWQLAVERETFKKLHIWSTPPELKAFETAFSDSARSRHRRQYLKWLKYVVVLPDCDEDAFGDYESNEERSINDDAYTKAVLVLTKTLSTWDSGYGLHLLLGCCALGDAESLSDSMPIPQEFRDRHDQWFSSKRHRLQSACIDCRSRYSYISIFSALPEVTCITSLQVDGTSRDLRPSSQLALVASFLNLTKIYLSYSEPADFFPLRRQLRQELASSLATTIFPSSAKVLDLEIQWPFTRDYWPLPILTDPKLGPDPVLHNLGVLIGDSRLNEVRYSGMVDWSLFWPPSKDLSWQNQAWANVEVVEIDFKLGSPSGQWYFNGEGRLSDHYSNQSIPLGTHEYLAPGYGTRDDTNAGLAYKRSLDPEFWPTSEEDRHPFLSGARSAPNDETMMPLLESVARRLEASKSLKKWTMQTEWTVRPGLSGLWEIHYLAAGLPICFKTYMDKAIIERGRAEHEAGLSCPYVYFHVGDWRPTKHVLDLFRNAGGGGDAVVVFLPFMYGS